FGSVGQGILANILGYAAGVVSLFMAITQSFKMQGEAKGVLDKWSKLGKNTFNATVGRPAVGGGIALANATGVGDLYRAGARYKKSLDSNYKNSIEDFKNATESKSLLARANRARREASVKRLQNVRDNYEAADSQKRRE